ncbi:MAG TPA: rhomboid family intramembrane serine protease [Kofleriaceae bacterium]
MKLRVAYNAPVVLTFAIIAAFVTCLPQSMRLEYFASHGQLHKLTDYTGLITQIFGHQNWQHYLGNFTMILLIGPILEERHGSLALVFMIIVTAVVSGIVGVVLSSPSYGASGVVFMMIVLASTANIKEGEIPLTFIAIATLYLGGEVYKAIANTNDGISHVAHLCGGVAGAAFGFLGSKGKRASTKKSPNLDNLGLPAADLMADGKRKKTIG